VTVEFADDAPFRFNGRMDGSNLRQAARASTSFLMSTIDRDWDRQIPDMTWTVREVVAHVCDVLLWYSTDLAAGTAELNTMDLKVRPTEPPDQLIATLTAFSNTLAYVVDGVPAGQRGFHPDGMADGTGFAAMGCDELLVHARDAAIGLGLEFEPPEVLSGMIVRRLFPWAPRDAEPWPALLWANGRRELPGLQRQVDWHRHAAPLTDAE